MKTCIAIIGKSGSGKSTLSRYLKRHGFDEILSITDRPMRSYEKNDGRHNHKFVSKEDFNKIRPSDMLAYFYMDGNRYCATAEQLTDKCTYVVDQDSYEIMKRRAEELDCQFIPVYVKAGLLTRINRVGIRRVFRDFMNPPVPFGHLAKKYNQVRGYGSNMTKDINNIVKHLF